MRRPSTRTSRRGGAVIVEMAICLPLVVAMVLCTIDLALVVVTRITVASAARVAAQAGATKQFTTYTQNDWLAYVRLQAEREMQTLPGFQAADFGMEISTAADGEESRVIVEATYRETMLIDWTGQGRDLNLSHTVSMRQYR